MSNKPVYSGVKVFSEILSEKMTITGEYSLPTMDGSAGQVIMTDGAGNSTFQSITGFLSPTSIVNGTGINWTQIGPVTLQGNVTLAPFSTTNLAEGVNLYYTNTRVNNQVASLIQPGLAGTGPNSIAWTYNSGLGTLTPTVSLTPFSTSNLVEGTRLYFTNERVDDRVATLLQTGTTGAGPASLTWSYNDPANTLTPIISLAPFTTDNLSEGSTNIYFTDERVDDRVSNLIINSTTIGWTYNDLANTLCADVIGVAPINVQRNNSLCGTQSTLNFKPGTGINLSVVNDIGNNRVNVEICSTGGVDNAVIVLGTGPGTSVRKDSCNTASGYYVTTSGGYCNTASNSYSTIAGGKNNTVTASHSTISGGYCNSILTSVVGGIASFTYSGTATDGTYILPQDATTGSGSGAIFKVTFVSNAVVSIIIVNPGSGYSMIDTITIYGASITGGTVGQDLVISPYISNGQYSTIGGGAYNIAGSACNGFSTISGGYCNVTDGDGSVIGGGSLNVTNCGFSSILGGGANFAQCLATVGGGYYNSASAPLSNILGGGCNTASGCYSVIGGGCENISSGIGSTILGGANNTASGQYSIIVGGCNNISCVDFSTVSGGYCNTATGCASTIGGGWCNSTSDTNSVIGGGRENIAACNNSTVSGGRENIACGNKATVGGGKGNTVSGYSSTISGGYCNTISNSYSTIGGGCCNTTSGIYGHSTISGGRENCATNYSTVGGGLCNTSSGYYSTIGGGFLNSASCNRSTVGGGYNNTASNSNSTVGGGTYNTASGQYSTVGGGCCNIASNCNSAVGGGSANTSSGCYSTVGGGYFNTASGYNAVVAGGRSNSATCNAGVVGGFQNTASGYRSIVGGGYSNTSSCRASAILGGAYNTASSYYSIIGGGRYNTASCNYSTIGGGCNNLASNCYSTVGGGWCNSASGKYSNVVGGYKAIANRYGERAYASGAFTTQGDAQHVQLIARNVTIGESFQVLYLDGASIRPTLASGQVFSGTVNILGVNTTGSVIARYLRQVTISNIGGTTSLIGSVITLGTDVTGGTVISITADDTNDALKIEVTGVAANTIGWVAHIDGVQITI
jgi:hypothetical protein